MPLFNPPPTPEDDSLAARKTRMAARVKLESDQNYETLCNMQKSGIRLVWENDQGLSPQEVCDALGTLAVSTFAMHGALTTAIATIAALSPLGAPPDILLPTFDWTENPDGTITILETPYSP